MAFIPAYIFVLFFLILVDYAAGILIERAEGSKRRLLLAISLLSNLSLLGFFKYFNFLNANLTSLAGALGSVHSLQPLNFLLPIGLSFHTFQSMSYTIEVYRGRQKAEKHLGILALYVMFYPQLVAGPIERSYNLIQQFREKHAFDYARVTDGLKLMAWGFFKKLVIADRLAVMVNQVYAHPVDYSGPDFVLATLAFAYQIYCDFSGYSDIARGSAQVMGFRLMLNFDRVYHAPSISDFWRRWHISLSTWFRDYLYVPLGGNRVTQSRQRTNIFITFLVSGLWHGANWTFVVWGGLHGAYLLIENWLRAQTRRQPRLDALAKNRAFYLLRVVTVFALVSFAWIFFRANSISDALYIVSHLLVGWDNPAIILSRARIESMGITMTELSIALAAIGALETVQLLQNRGSVRDSVRRKPALIRWALYYALAMTILLFGVYAEREFIYFQF